MLEILHNQLVNTETPETYSLYDRMITLFEKYDVQDYQLAYEDLMISTDGAYDGVTVFDNQALARMTIDFARSILREHHIKLLDQATMLSYIQVLEFIKEIENTEYLQQCYDILTDTALDPNDKFSECIELVTGVLFEDSMQYIDTVEQCVIDAMTTYFENRLALLSATETLDDASKEVYRELDKFVRLIGGSKMRCAQYLFDDGGCIGMPFEFHFKANQAYLLELPMTAMLYECIGFALLSENGLTNPEHEIILVLGQYIGDLDRLTVIQYELSQLLIQYRNEISSGVGFVV